MTHLGPGGYTRGWETIGHYLAMLRASIRTHLFLSLSLGLLVGSLWFYLGLGEARPFLGSYLKAAVLSALDGECCAGS